MKLVQQPPDSRLCGQACVAMLCGVSLERAIQLVGRKEGTRTKELAHAIRKLGYHCESRLTVLGENVNWLMAQENMLVKMTNYDDQGKRVRNWHWVVVHDRKVYDPASFDVLSRFHTVIMGRPTSYLQVITGRPAVQLIS